MLRGIFAQVEEAAASSQRQLAGHIEELQRQLEGAAHEVDEWRAQASEASEHAQQLEQQLPELSSRAARAEVRRIQLLWIAQHCRALSSCGITCKPGKALAHILHKVYEVQCGCPGWNYPRSSLANHQAMMQADAAYKAQEAEELQRKLGNGAESAEALAAAQSQVHGLQEQVQQLQAALQRETSRAQEALQVCATNCSGRHIGGDNGCMPLNPMLRIDATHPSAIWSDTGQTIGWDVMLHCALVDFITMCMVFD